MICVHIARLLGMGTVLLVGPALWPKSLSAGEPPAVVVTLRPFHSITAAVMEGAGEPKLLLAAAAATPHGHGLKPSEFRMLSRADLVVWGGPGLEGFLSTPMNALPARVSRLALVKALAEQVASGGPGVVRRRRPPGLWALDDDGALSSTPHELITIDHHVWLDPANAQALAGILADRLSAEDPARAALYRENARRFAARIDGMDAGLAARLLPLQGKRFIVFHDFLLYFERRYGLTAVAAVTTGHETAPGARHVARLRQLTVKGKVACVFVEPQFEPRLAKALIQGTNVRSRTVDPLGANLTPGPGLYPALMERLARSVADCLA